MLLARWEARHVPPTAFARHVAPKRTNTVSDPRTPIAGPLSPFFHNAFQRSLPRFKEVGNSFGQRLADRLKRRAVRRFDHRKIGLVIVFGRVLLFPHRGLAQQLAVQQIIHVGRPAYARVRARKNRIISRVASGPLGSVKDPRRSPPNHACAAPCTSQCSTTILSLSSLNSVHV
jgi:hypothetical protein